MRLILTRNMVKRKLCNWQDSLIHWKRINLTFQRVHNSWKYQNRNWWRYFYRCQYNICRRCLEFSHRLRMKYKNCLRNYKCRKSMKKWRSPTPIMLRSLSLLMISRWERWEIMWRILRGNRNKFMGSFYKLGCWKCMLSLKSYRNGTNRFSGEFNKTNRIKSTRWQRK